MFPSKSELPLVFEYEDLPFAVNGKKTLKEGVISVLIFNYSLFLNTNSVGFYFGTFTVVVFLIFLIHPSESNFENKGTGCYMKKLTVGDIKKVIVTKIFTQNILYYSN